MSNDITEKTPLVDLLRDIPKAHRIEWAMQLDEDGRHTGRSICLIGRLAHEAADCIAELESSLLRSQAENERLREALLDATESYDEYSSYAGEYLCKKHGVEEDVARLKAIARGEKDDD